MAVAIFLVALDLVALWLVLSGAPFIPTNRSGVQKILAACEVRPGMKAMDIGSGDGRIVIALAQAGAEAHGVEINPLLVWWSRRRIRDAGLQGRAFIHWADLWRTDLSAYDVLTLFGVTHIMRRLEKKLRRELRSGSRVVSIGFRFPDWPVATEDELIFVFEQG